MPTPVFEEKSNPYEILIRFDPATGLLKGAHQVRINIVMRDGVVIHAQEGEAEPIDLADFAASELMPQVTQDALLQVEQERAAVANIKGLNDLLNDGINEARAEADALRGEITGLRDQVAVQSAAAAQAGARADLLQADKASLESQVDAMRTESAEMASRMQAALTGAQALENELAAKTAALAELQVANLKLTSDLASANAQVPAVEEPKG